MYDYKQKVSEAEYEGWPVNFTVCEEHKKLFKEYAKARVSDEKLCVLCHPVENDSLGG